jgi:hypothetical protein
MRKLGIVFGICSDDIELSSAQDSFHLAAEETPERRDSEFATERTRSGRTQFRASNAGKARYDTAAR